MIPCLYPSDETAYSNNGIGKLADAVSCLVTEKRNGSYELEMEYPHDGLHAEDLVNGNIILAKPNETVRAQPFRIYKVTAPMKGQLTVFARHISYQLNFITVSPLSVLTGTQEQPQLALDALKAGAVSDCPFSFSTDIRSTEYFGILQPESIRNCLGGIDGSVLDTYGGEYEWDRYDVILHKSRGSDNNVRIVYGKNLVDFKMEKSIENTITGVHPYWADPDTGDVFELPEKVVRLSEPAIGYEKIITLDCTEQFDAQPAEAQLRSYAESYLSGTEYAEPDIDMDIDFLALWQMPGYEDIAEAEKVSLCDTVHVYISKLGIEVSARVTETVYDVLLEKYKSITLSNSLTGSRNSSIVTSLVTANQAKSMISVTESAIRLSVSKTYVTKTYLSDSYSTTVDIKSWIEAGDEAVTLEYQQALKSYATTAQVTALIQLSEEGIVSSYTSALKEYSKTTEIEAMISELEEGITLSYTKAISSLSSGGTNLLVGTVSPVTSPAADRIRIRGQAGSSYYGSTSYITLTANEEHGYRVERTGSSSYPYYRFGTSPYTNDLEAGKEYTLSFDIKYKLLSAYNGSSTPYFYICRYDDSDTPGTTGLVESYECFSFTAGAEQEDWVHVCYTFTISDGATQNYLLLRPSQRTSSYYSAGDYFEFKNIVLTEGNIDTGWMPSAEEYSTADEVKSMIALSEEGIELSVTETLKSYTKTDEVRSRFAMDSTSITVESGVIKFDSDSISINSTNFKLTTSGEVTAKGSFTSGSDSSYKAVVSSGQIAGYYKGTEVCVLTFGASHNWTVDGASYTYRGMVIECEDLQVKNTMFDINADYLNINYASNNYYYGGSGTVKIVTGLNYTTRTSVVSNLSMDSSGNASWNYGDITYASGYSYTTIRFQKGLMVTSL